VRYATRCSVCLYVCTDCFWLLDALLEYTVHGNMPPVLEERKSSVTELDSSRIPLSRREGYWTDFIYLLAYCALFCVVFLLLYSASVFYSSRVIGMSLCYHSTLSAQPFIISALITQLKALEQMVVIYNVHVGW